MNYLLTEIARRLEYAHPRLFTALRVSRTSNAAFRPAVRLPPFAQRSGGHASHATAEPGCPDSDTHRRGEPGASTG